MNTSINLNQLGIQIRRINLDLEENVSHDTYMTLYETLLIFSPSPSPNHPTNSTAQALDQLQVAATTLTNQTSQ